MTDIKNIVEKINRFLGNSNCSDFQIKSFDGFRLHLIGSFDLCYYHEIEIIFNDVYKIAMETSFVIDCNKNPFQFRKIENARCSSETIEIIITDDTNAEQSIVCENLDLVIERVKYHDSTGN